MTVPKPQVPKGRTVGSTYFWGLALAVAVGIIVVGLVVVALVPGLTSHQSAVLPGVSTLGAVVGVVGAIGGIVVGLTSLFALFQIDRQVEAAFDRRYEEHRQRLTAEGARWATGLRYWTQAMVDPDPDRAQYFLTLCLDHWPQAPRARTEMAERLWTHMETRYLWELQPGRMDALWAAFHRHEELPPEPVIIDWADAFQWWVRASETEPEARVDQAVLGANLYARRGDLSQMMAWLRRRAALSDPWTVTDAQCVIWGGCAAKGEAVRELETVLAPFTRLETPLAEVLRPHREWRRSTPGMARASSWFTVGRQDSTHEQWPAVAQLRAWGPDGWMVTWYNTQGEFIQGRDVECVNDEELVAAVGDVIFVRPVGQ